MGREMARYGDGVRYEGHGRVRVLFARKGSEDRVGECVVGEGGRVVG